MNEKTGTSHGTSHRPFHVIESSFQEAGCETSKVIKVLYEKQVNEFAKVKIVIELNFRI